jgi:hypothetical protein
MSSTAQPPVTSTPNPTPHPAWYARAGTWLLKIGTEVKNAIIKVAGYTPVIASEIAKIAPTAEAVSNLILPGSGSFEAHLLDVWGVAANAVSDAGAAAGANGISITLDQTLVNDIKNFLPAVEKYMSSQASPAPPAPGQ